MCRKWAASTKIVAMLARLACHCALVIAFLCRLGLHLPVCVLLECETIKHGLQVLGRLGWLCARLALCALIRLDCACCNHRRCSVGLYVQLLSYMCGARHAGIGKQAGAGRSLTVAQALSFSQPPAPGMAYMRPKT